MRLPHSRDAEKCSICTSVGNVSEVEVLQGLNDFVGVTPAAGRVVEDLVGEEVLIGGVEGGAAGAVQPVGIHLNCCGIS